jgi:uncharacterized protein YecE (DUF72 family)
MESQPSGQLSLFSSPEEADLVRGVGPSERQLNLARRLPECLYLGTSSWSFPGWKGIVYDRGSNQRLLARHGLKAYASHPLFRCVGLDRTYYAPIASEEYAAYANAVSDDFRFIVKAQDLLTRAYVRSAGPRSRPQQNEIFLDSDYAIREVIRPCLEGLGEKLGVLLFQFPPQSNRALGGTDGFAERLARFIEALPRGPVYAVELRNQEMLTSRYVQALQEAGGCHCVNVHPTMPPPEEQAALVNEVQSPVLMLRWMLKRDSTYEQAREAFAPFDRMAVEDKASRRAVADLCRRALARKRTAFVVINNKAEGSAPLSVFELAEWIAGGTTEDSE